MICLTLDTAGTACAACIYDSDRDVVLGAISEDIGKGHAERLMGIINDVMAQTNISYQDIDRIITTTGPGSFTGIRVGVATARGFGVGLNIPVVGVSNLDAILEEFSTDYGPQERGKLGVAISAGRGQAYCLFDFDTIFAPAGKPFVAKLEDIKNELAAKKEPFVLCGNAAADMTSSRHGSEYLAEKEYPGALIGVVARLGAQYEDILKKPEPLYLRKPDAIPQQGFAVERVE